MPTKLTTRRKKDESFGLPAGQVASFAVLLAALLALFFLFPGQIGLISGVVMAVVYAGKLVVEQLEAHENDKLPPASRKFRELADPRRPLAADDPVTVTPPPAIHPGAAPPGLPSADADSDG